MENGSYSVGLTRLVLPMRQRTNVLPGCRSGVAIVRQKACKEVASRIPNAPPSPRRVVLWWLTRRLTNGAGRVTEKRIGLVLPGLLC